jgi:hypothetical protein
MADGEQVQEVVRFDNDEGKSDSVLLSCGRKIKIIRLYNVT